MFQKYRVLALNPVNGEPMDVLGKTITKQEIEDFVFIKVPKTMSMTEISNFAEELKRYRPENSLKKFVIIPGDVEVCVGELGEECSMAQK